MIDKDKVKQFWDSRADTYNKVAFESIANLEQDPDNLQLKIAAETSKVFAWLPDLSGKSVLDLGAGVGQWSFRFAGLGARRILAVEYSGQLAQIGRTEAQARGVGAIEFQTCAAEHFTTDEPFDIVFVSGLLVYMTDIQVTQLVANMRRYCTTSTVLMLRDGMGIQGRHEIRDRYSEHLKTFYSATYRTREQYIELMAHASLVLVKDENMFDEGHPLNKYEETRLRLFLFRFQP